MRATFSMGLCFQTSRETGLEPSTFQPASSGQADFLLYRVSQLLSQHSWTPLGPFASEEAIEIVEITERAHYLAA